MGVIARQSIKGALANYLGVAIGFVTTFFVVTRMLTAEEVGLTRMLVDAAMLFSSLAQLGVNSTVVKFFPHFNTKSTASAAGGAAPYHGLFGWSLLLPLAGFVLFVLAFVLFRGPLTGAYVEQAPLLADYLYMLPMLTLCALYLTVFETNASVLMRITVPKLVREVGIRLLTLAAYLLYGFGVVDIDGFVWLFCGSYAVAMLLNLVYLLAINRFDLHIFKIERGFVDRRLGGEMVRYSLFMTATVLAANVPLLNSLFLGAKSGAASAGVYAIASYIAAVVEVPYRSLGAISRPVIATAVKAGDWDEVGRLGRQVSLHQLMVSLLIFYTIWINLDALYALLPGGDQYRAGVGVVLVLGLAKVVNSSLSISTDVLNYSRLYVWGLPFIAVLTATAVLLNAPLIDAVGISGAACATLAAYILYFGPMLVFMWRRLRFSPLSSGQLKMLALTAAMFALDAAWRALAAPLFGSAVLADAAVKSIVLVGLMCVGAYAWKISPTVNAMADGMMKKLKIK